jgi:diguanylate cyclase (GGDEF)-like protein/putative nucleotidyltransferase with HDIG domain
MWAYLVAVWAAGAAVLLKSLSQVPFLAPVPFGLFVLLACAAAVTPVYLFRKSSVSVAWTVGYASSLLWGAGAATLIGAAMGLTTSLFPKRYKGHKVLFNVAANALVGWAMGKAVEASAGLDLVPGVVLRYALPPMIHFVGLSALIAIVIALSSGGSPVGVWRENFAWLSVPYLFLAPIGIALAEAQRLIGPIGVVALAVPLFMARYSFRLYMDKSKEAEQYVRSLEMANHQSERQIGELAGMYRTAVAINSTLNLKETLRIVAETCKRVTGAAWVEVRVLDEELRSVCAITEGELPPSAAQTVNQLVQWASASGQAETAMAEGETALWTLPLEARNRAVGALTLHTDSVPKEEESMALRTFAAQAAVAIANARLYEQAEMMAITEGLTGLYHHRHLLTLLEEALKEQQCWDNGLLLIDIDDFKRFNNGFGHQAGDFAIRHVADAIKAQLGPQDIASRYGGDEFVIVLRGRTQEEMEQFAAGLLKNCQSFRYQGVSLPISLSMGLAVRTPDDQRTSDLIGRADEAAYYSKAQGKGRLTVHDKMLKDPNRRQALTSYRRGSMERSPDPVTLEMVKAIVFTVEVKDSYTYGHSLRVQELATSLARFIGMSDTEVETIGLASMLHDIGKVAVPDEILNKPGRLTDDEFRLIKRHPQIAADILKRVGHLDELVPLVLHHHERLDGKGYPAGLKGAEIPIAARVIAVADAYEAMTSERIYHPARKQTDALLELERHAGAQFDPFLVSAFERMLSTRTPAIRAAM